MHFLRESLACLPTSSSLDGGDFGGVAMDQAPSGSQKKPAKWSPAEARHSKKKFQERLITVIENNVNQRKEQGEEKDAFLSFVAETYKKQDEEGKKAFRKDVTSAMLKYM